MAEPFKVGVLSDGAVTPEGDALRVWRMRFAEAVEAGELDRPVEVVARAGAGLPEGTAHGMRRAWLELAGEGALVIMGPGITDNALAVRDLAEAHHVPTINFSGCERTRGEYNFHWQLGSLPDEGMLIARALRAAGIASIAVIRDRSPIGDEYWSYFSEAVEELGVSVRADQKVSPVQTDFTNVVAAARASGADGLVYLGFGQVLRALWKEMEDVGWKPPAFTNTAGLHWYVVAPEDRARSAGWVYVDMYDEENEAFQAWAQRYERRFGARPAGPFEAMQYDIATLVVHALRHATVHTPEGVKEGLERVHQLPVACAGAGSVQGFGPWERTAVKGVDYLLLRTMGATDNPRYSGLRPWYETRRG